ncbi:Re/Si-specific NAD(P)(+) transhydrogenase subunit alpha, partial [Candidatus Uhrbacteria bacterium]|nr:Re/Si-specific NAD(P)(+) transhydrogenase subunit alpha [Candidatus Uhrbacteria bacterium]
MTEQVKPIVVGVPKETFPGERRVALIADVVPSVIKSGAEVHVESGAGLAAGITDESFVKKGAMIATRDEIFAKCELVFQVRTFGANPEAGKADLGRIRPGQIVIGTTDSLNDPSLSADLAKTGATVFSLELVPRITRAQSMDVLSSMATVAGYKAILLAAEILPRFFPMFMTAAGTIAPARVFIVGVGVAGLQAISTAKRLGAVVSAYDIRPAVKDQVKSVGAKFVEFDLQTAEAEDKGGYAKAMGEEFYRKQREMMGNVVREQDVVVTTAAVPGKKAPILVTTDMVKQMTPGSVIVDLAAERGGNCECTKPGETVVVNGVTVMGPFNLPSTVPYHASQMFSKNFLSFFQNMVKNGKIDLNLEDEIIRDTMITKGGEVVSPRVKELMAA